MQNFRDQKVGFNDGLKLYQRTLRTCIMNVGVLGQDLIGTYILKVTRIELPSDTADDG